MTNQERNDQAELLRKKVDATKMEDEFSTASLPSRKEVHGKKKQKMVWKIKFPLVKLLALFFVLLPITIFAFYTHFTKDDKPVASNEKDKSSFSSEVNIEEDYEEGVTQKVETTNKEKGTNQVASANKNEPIDKKETNSKENSNSTTSGKGASHDDPKSNPSEEKTPVKNETQQPVTKPVTKPAEPEHNETKPSVVTHTVKQGETIFRIAMNYYKSQSGIEIIKQANGLSSNSIHVGQVLKIPLN